MTPEELEAERRASARRRADKRVEEHERAKPWADHEERNDARPPGRVCKSCGTPRKWAGFGYRACDVCTSALPPQP